MFKYAFLAISLILSACHSSDTDINKQEEPKNIPIQSEHHIWYEADIDSLEKVIYNVAHSLKIPYGQNSNIYSPNIYPNVIRDEDKTTNYPRKVYLRFLLNREIVDLTYANMILKQELEKAGGKMIRGAYFAHWKGYQLGQLLVFRNATESHEYNIRLVFDNSPYTSIEQAKEISLVLTELGNDLEIVNNHIDLITNNRITLSLLGDGEFSSEIANLASERNIETMLTIPLEAYPNRHSLNQLNAIKVQNPINKTYIQTMIRKLHRNLEGVKGLTHYWGDFASSESDFMQVVIDYCKSNNLYYIDAMTTSKSQGYQLALRNQLLSSRSLSYSQINLNNLDKYVKTNSNPILLVPLNDYEDIVLLKRLISFIDKNHFNIVYVTDLLSTDLPNIE